MSDRESIIGLLKKIQRRRRFNRVFKKLTAALSASIAILILFKILNLTASPGGSRLAILLGLLAAGTTVFVVCRNRGESSLDEIATALDARGNLYDQMKSAYWFLNNPGHSAWIDTQIARAAQTARAVPVDNFYPRTLPKTFYSAGLLALVLAVLNFYPVQSNRNGGDLEGGTSVAGVEDRRLSEDASLGEKKLKQLQGAAASESESASDDEFQNIDAAALRLIDEPEPRPDRLNQEDVEQLLLSEGGSGGPQVMDPNGRPGAAPPTIVKGEATHLDVQLQRERLVGQHNRKSEDADFKPSEKEASKTAFQYINPTLRPAESDLLDATRIPWEYRYSVKQYFDDIQRSSDR